MCVSRVSKTFSCHNVKLLRLQAVTGGPPDRYTWRQDPQPKSSATKIVDEAKDACLVLFKRMSAQWTSNVVPKRGGCVVRYVELASIRATTRNADVLPTQGIRPNSTPLWTGSISSTTSWLGNSGTSRSTGPRAVMRPWKLYFERNAVHRKFMHVSRRIGGPQDRVWRTTLTGHATCGSLSFPIAKSDTKSLNLQGGAFAPTSFDIPWPKKEGGGSASYMAS